MCVSIDYLPLQKKTAYSERQRDLQLVKGSDVPYLIAVHAILGLVINTIILAQSLLAQSLLAVSRGIFLGQNETQMHLICCNTEFEHIHTPNTRTHCTHTLLYRAVLVIRK